MGFYKLSSGHEFSAEDCAAAVLSFIRSYVLNLLSMNNDNDQPQRWRPGYVRIKPETMQSGNLTKWLL